MNKKYIELIDQLNQGYHMSDKEIGDLRGYLESHLRNLYLLKK